MERGDRLLPRAASGAAIQGRADPGRRHAARPLPAPRWRRVEQLAPDVLVARVPGYQRTSYDVEREGVPPAFVLEVVSQDSGRRDTEEKLDRYERIGVEEYALYSSTLPNGRRPLHPPLQGYWWDPVSGGFMRWEPDDEDRLWSAVLGLWLLERGGELRAQRLDGSLVLTPDEEVLARQEADLQAERARLRAEVEREGEAVARQQAEVERDREALARQRLKVELARLRADLEKRKQDP